MPDVCLCVYVCELTNLRSFLRNNKFKNLLEAVSALGMEYLLDATH